MQALKEQALAKIEAAYKIAEAHYNTTIPRVPVEFSNKMTSTGGTFSYRNCRLTGKFTPLKITLSAPVMKLNPDEFLQDTPGHEAAHHIALHVFGTEAGKGHGPAWKQVMRVIGQDPRRCHTMETVKRNVTKYVYTDSLGGTHEMSAQRHRKLQAGTTYTVRSTGARIEATGYTATNKPVKTATPKPAPRKPKSTGKPSNPEQVRDLLRAELNTGRTRADVASDMTFRQTVADLVGITRARAGVLIRDNVNRV